MTFFDIILLVIIGGFALFGFWFGFIHSLGSLIGTVLGALLASRWYEGVASAVYGKFGGSLNVTKIIVFLLIFIIVNRLVGFIFWVIEKVTGIFTRLPFIKSVDRMAGALFALVEGIFVIGLTLTLALRLPFLVNWIQDSRVAQELINFSRILIPLLPEALRAAQKIPELPLPSASDLEKLKDLKPLEQLAK